MSAQVYMCFVISNLVQFSGCWGLSMYPCTLKEDHIESEFDCMNGNQTLLYNEKNLYA